MPAGQSSIRVTWWHGLLRRLPSATHLDKRRWTPLAPASLARPLPNLSSVPTTLRGAPDEGCPSHINSSSGCEPKVRSTARACIASRSGAHRAAEGVSFSESNPCPTPLEIRHLPRVGVWRPGAARSSVGATNATVRLPCGLRAVLVYASSASRSVRVMRAAPVPVCWSRCDIPACREISSLLGQT